METTVYVCIYIYTYIYDMCIYICTFTPDSLYSWKEAYKREMQRCKGGD